MAGGSSQRDGSHWLEAGDVVSEISSGIASNDLFADVPDETSDWEEFWDSEANLTNANQSEIKVTKLAKIIDRMEPVGEGILRSTRIHRVLSCFGRAWWAKDDCDMFHRSEATENFDQFVSHSWHMKPWKKVLLFLILKRGSAALVFGFLGALGMFPAFQTGALVSLVDLNHLPTGVSCWGLTTGILLALLVFALWRTREKIFVDRICINQHDVRMKAQGVLSIGAFLKRSRSILVMWAASRTRSCEYQDSFVAAGV